MRNIRSNNRYVASLLNPFGTTPIKPAFDYPLNTYFVETTLELPLTPTLSVGPYPIGNSGTYGFSAVVLPHSFSTPVNVNNQLGIYSASVAANTRLFTQFS